MKRDHFPQRIERESCVVIIYKTPEKGCESFTVVHYDTSGMRCGRTFAE